VRLSDTKAAAEVKALEDFYSMLQNDPNRAFYGFVNNFEFIDYVLLYYACLTVLCLFCQNFLFELIYYMSIITVLFIK